MLDQQVAHRPVDSKGDAGCPRIRPRSFDDTRIDITGVEQGRNDRVDRLVLPDLVRVNAAENQQMVFPGQVVQCPDHSVKTLVSTEKPKHADQPALYRHSV